MWDTKDTQLPAEAVVDGEGYCPDGAMDGVVVDGEGYCPDGAMDGVVVDGLLWMEIEKNLSKLDQLIRESLLRTVCYLCNTFEAENSLESSQETLRNSPCKLEQPVLGPKISNAWTISRSVRS